MTLDRDRDAAAKRLNLLRERLSHARDRLGLEAGFRLWDRSTVPAGLPADSFAIVLTDEGVIPARIRRPRLETRYR